MSDHDDSGISSCDGDSSPMSPTNGPTSPGEAFRDLRLRKSCGEILLSRYQKVGDFIMFLILNEPVVTS